MGCLERLGGSVDSGVFARTPDEFRTSSSSSVKSSCTSTGWIKISPSLPAKPILQLSVQGLLSLDLGGSWITSSLAVPFVLINLF